MKSDLKKNLILLSFVMYLIPKAESKRDDGIPVHGITGDNVTAEFTFQDLVINSRPNKPILYKNDNKIGSCTKTSKNCSERFVLSDVDNSSAILHIINITLEDEGIYHVLVPVDGKTPVIFSNTISFTVKTRNETTETMTTCKSTMTGIPETPFRPFLIYINVSIIILICFCMSLLCWLHRTCPRKPAVDPPAQSNSTTQQGYCGRSVTVSCVEYGELDFPNRPARDDTVKPAEVTSKAQDSVEYAAIIFPQRKQTPGGRMRDKQRVHPATS